MSNSLQGHAYGLFASDVAAEERAAFIRRTYIHLGGAVLTFAGLEAIIFSTPDLRDGILALMLPHWWMAILAFVVVGWVAQWWARRATSPGVQYAGLALYTAAEAVMFVPLLWLAQRVSGPDSSIIAAAGLLTMIIFGGLTAIVFTTRADFSFLRMALMLATLAALGVAVAGAVMGFSLGLFFSGAMVVLAAGYILYDTSMILHHYRTDQHVAAALELFASVALLFWDLLWLLIQLQSND
jgi:FtsH-binding integral membrane protein